MKTIIESLELAYTDLKKSPDPEVAVTCRNIYLILEHLKFKSESGLKIGYFYNEKGDYTITLLDEPVAVAFAETEALKLVNYVKGLSLRIDVMSKIKPFSVT